jgi:hypothetical protein
MAFANLVRMPCCEMMTLLGHPPNVAAEGQRPVTPENTPPIPTVHMTPAHNGKWHLLLHLELSAQAIAKIVATLEEMRSSPTSPPPPLKRTDTSLSARAVTPGAP